MYSRIFNPIFCANVANLGPSLTPMLNLETLGLREVRSIWGHCEEFEANFLRHFGSGSTLVLLLHYFMVIFTVN